MGGKKHTGRRHPSPAKKVAKPQRHRTTEPTSTTSGTAQTHQEQDTQHPTQRQEETKTRSPPRTSPQLQKRKELARENYARQRSDDPGPAPDVQHIVNSSDDDTESASETIHNDPNQATIAEATGDTTATEPTGQRQMTHEQAQTPDPTAKN